MDVRISMACGVAACTIACGPSLSATSEGDDLGDSATVGPEPEPAAGVTSGASGPSPGREDDNGPVDRESDGPTPPDIPPPSGGCGDGRLGPELCFENMDVQAVLDAVPLALAAGDIDGDGVDEIVVLGVDVGGTTSLVLGRYGGRFEVEFGAIPTPNGVTATEVAIADLTSQGAAQIVLLAGGDVYLLRWARGGWITALVPSLGPTTAIATVRTKGGPRLARLGLGTLQTWSFVSPAVATLEGEVAMPSGILAPGHFSAAGEGGYDAATLQGGTLAVVLGVLSDKPMTFEVAAPETFVLAPVAGDVDGDGIDALAKAGRSAIELYDLDLGASVAAAGSGPVWAVAFGDFDSVSGLDLVAVAGEATVLAFGGFDPETMAFTSQAEWGLDPDGPHLVETADVDGDGHDDIIVALGGGPDLKLLLSNP